MITLAAFYQIYNAIQCSGSKHSRRSEQCLKGLNVGEALVGELAPLMGGPVDVEQAGIQRRLDPVQVGREELLEVRHHGVDGRVVAVQHHVHHVLEPGLRIRIWIQLDSDLFGRIRSRIRKMFTYRYFGNVKLYKQGKNILKIEVLHIFR